MSATIGITEKSCGKSSIDRHKPAILESYLSDMAWNKFCDDVDKTSEIFSTIYYWTGGSFLLILATFFIAYFLGGGYLFAIVAPGAIVLVGSYVVLFRKQNKFDTEINKVMDDMNRTYQGQLTFHFNRISTQGGEGTAHEIVVSINKSCGAGASSAPKDATTRLEDLEKAKHLLSDQEYEDKRRDILSDV